MLASSLANVSPSVMDASTRTSSRKNRSHSGEEKRQRRTALGRNMGPMRSIRRGTFEWQALIRPFVSDLAFRCLVRRRSESEISFQSYSTSAAVLFVDLSNYSRITTAISHRGASVLSSVVNAYLQRLLKISQTHGGDIVKFAGDAVLVVWEASDSHEELRKSVLCAAKCVLHMQRYAGEHEVEGTTERLTFRIHCGLTCGELDTEIFVAPTHVSMQRLFHAVGGEPLQQIGRLVDVAKAGQVCISKKCRDILGSLATVRPVDTRSSSFVLESLLIDDQLDDVLDQHLDCLIQQRDDVRMSTVEEDFIPPGVLKLLTHSGQAPTQLAQMRNLCVLFIAMTSSGNPVNWLMEIQAILDTNRCPMIQIIDDDKGVHVVAAINLYESVPDASRLALDICRALQSAQVGCAVGVAMGSSFCGVTGCAAVACRWDITGPAAVRAARLMQHALKYEMEVAIDESVFEASSVPFQMTKAQTGVWIKGSSVACTIFTLSNTRKSTSNMILEVLALPRVHQGTVDQVVQVLNGPKPRGVVILTGPPFAGKKLVLKRAAGIASLVPCLHVCDESGGLMQLGRTMATWFGHYQNEDISSIARIVLEHLEHHRWSRAHDECVRLVNHVLSNGYSSCFVVDRCQCLDDFSISLMRECLDPRIRSFTKLGSFSSQSSGLSDLGDGRIFFLCTHLPLYHWRMAECFARNLRRTRNFETPILAVGEVTREELREVVAACMDLKIDDDWLDILSETTGNMVGYFLHRCKVTFKRPTTTAVSDELSLLAPPKMARVSKNMTVMEVNAGLAMKFTQIYDELPPRYQLFLKVLTILNRRCQLDSPVVLLKEALNDIINDEEELDAALDTMMLELVDMYLIKIDDSIDGQRLISFMCPALSDVVFDVCTPAQVRFISQVLIDRLEDHVNTDFRVPLAMAALCGNTGEHNLQKQFWRQSHQHLQAGLHNSSLNSSGICRMKELIGAEIEAAGFSSQDILGDDFGFTVEDVQSLGQSDGAIMLKNYCAPISLGPMAHSLTVITRVVALEILAFRDTRRRHEEARALRGDLASALERYKREVNQLETFMELEGLGLTVQERLDEIALLQEIARPGMNEAHACEKREHFLHRFVPRFVEARLRRLYLLSAKLRRGAIPVVIQWAPEPIRESYKALVCHRDRNDAVQDALVTLALHNWTPKLVPEDLPLFQYQTVARVRDEVLHRLTDEETKQFKHQHTIDDFEAFLLSTAILNENMSNNRDGTAGQHTLQFDSAMMVIG